MEAYDCSETLAEAPAVNAPGLHSVMVGKNLQQTVHFPQKKNRRTTSSNQELPFLESEFQMCILHMSSVRNPSRLWLRSLFIERKRTSSKPMDESSLGFSLLPPISGFSNRSRLFFYRQHFSRPDEMEEIKEKVMGFFS